MRTAVVLASLFACAACGGQTMTSPGQQPSAPQAPPGGSCFLLHELGVGRVRRSPDEMCNERLTPASTFKIPHALAALDSGVLAGADVVLPYQGGLDGEAPPIWKRDHTLSTAMRYSVVWYFQRIAGLLGPVREKDYLARFDYGNRDTSSGLTTFWLDGSLRVTPFEEEAFLVRLYEDALPVSHEAMRVVREILIQPRGVVVNALGEHPFDAPWPEDAVVSAKTGSADDVTWLVGDVRRGRRSWVFISCVVSRRERDPLAAIHLAALSLREEGVL